MSRPNSQCCNALHRFSWHSVSDSRSIELMPVRYSSNNYMFLQPGLVDRCMSL